MSFAFCCLFVAFLARIEKLALRFNIWERPKEFRPLVSSKREAGARVGIGVALLVGTQTREEWPQKGNEMQKTKNDVWQFGGLLLYKICLNNGFKSSKE